jgi:hypothetical protein
VHQNLAGFVEDFVNEPTTMPWGNRSLLFRDPDGNLVNFFTPSPRPPSTSSPADEAAASPDPSTLPGRNRRTARGSARGIALPLPVHDVCCAENCGPACERYRRWAARLTPATWA